MGVILQREIKNGVPLASRSKTLKETGCVRNLKSLKRADRAFILAKINNELGNPQRAEAAARACLDEPAGTDAHSAAKKARELGFEDLAKEFARKAVEYYTEWEDPNAALAIALEFSIKDSASAAAASLAERFILDGDAKSAETLVRLFKIASSLEEFAESHIEGLMGKGQCQEAARLADKVSLGEKAKLAMLKHIESQGGLPSDIQLETAREYGATEAEICSATGAALETGFKNNESPKGTLFSLGDLPLPPETKLKIAVQCIREIAKRWAPVDALRYAREHNVPKAEIRDIAIQAIFLEMGKEEGQAPAIADEFGIGKEELARMAEMLPK